MAPRTIIACDPSSRALAFCAINESGERRTFKAVAEKGVSIVSVVPESLGFLAEEVERNREIRSMMIEIGERPAEDADCLHFIVEDQITQAKGAQRLKLISHARGVVEGVARVLGYTVMPAVMPVAWQTKILGCRVNSKSAERKKLAKEMASTLMEQKITDTDIADAVCICEYARNRLEMAEKLEQSTTHQHP